MPVVLLQGSIFLCNKLTLSSWDASINEQVQGKAQRGKLRSREQRHSESWVGPLPTGVWGYAAVSSEPSADVSHAGCLLQAELWVKASALNTFQAKLKIQAVCAAQLEQQGELPLQVAGSLGKLGAGGNIESKEPLHRNLNEYLI